jgi:hypothetical protein
MAVTRVGMIVGMIHKLQSFPGCSCLISRLQILRSLAHAERRFIRRHHWPPLQIVPKNETRKKKKKKKKKQLLYKSAMQVLKAEKNVSSKREGKNTKLCMINTICKPTGNSRRRQQPKPVTTTILVDPNAKGSSRPERGLQRTLLYLS